MALSLSEVVNIAKNQDWAHISNFSVDISPVNSSYASKIQWKNFSDIQKQIDVSLKSVDVPQHSVATIEEYVGTQWKHANSREDLFTCTMTFRDMNGGELYRRFKNALELTKMNYFNTCLFNIKVYLDSEYYETYGRTLIMETSEALIKSVSQLQLSHENGSEILEFSVEFKFNTPSYSKYFKGLNGSSIDVSSPFEEVKNKIENKVTSLVDKAINKGVGFISSKVDGLLKNW
nr:MAG TPA: Baseplate wedge protein [Caudoviricetes sp.]